MKLNKIFLVMLALILVSSIGIAVAEDVSVGGYTFTVPDGYNLVNTTDDLASMQLDEKNAISFATGVSDDIEAAKQNFLSQGKELIEEETLDFDGTEVNLQAFSTPGTDIKAYNYIVISDNGKFDQQQSNPAPFSLVQHVEGLARRSGVSHSKFIL